MSIKSKGGGISSKGGNIASSCPKTRDANAAARSRSLSSGFRKAGFAPRKSMPKASGAGAGQRRRTPRPHMR